MAAAGGPGRQRSCHCQLQERRVSVMEPGLPHGGLRAAIEL